MSGALAESVGRGTDALKDTVVKAFAKDPAHAGGAQDNSRSATGTASKSDSTANFNSPTNRSRARQSYSSSPK